MSDEPLAPAAGDAASGAESQVLSLPPDAHTAARMVHWLDAATHAASPDTRLFAKLIAERDVRHEFALLGFSQSAWRALLARHFAHTSAPAALLPVAVSTGEHAEFIRTLHALLLRHAGTAVHADDVHCLATIIAHACLRPDHLWRDLGLAGRDEVTWMLTRYFPTLVALNVANLRWKKFLAAQRALTLGLEPGPAPGCPGCEDYGYCFPDPR
jgi:nitrogen fixation protein NifQ